MMEDHIDELIAGALNGELNDEEQRALRQWLDAAGENRRLFDRARDLHLRARALYPASEPDVERALLAVKRRRHHRAWRPLARGAAAVLLLLAGGGWWYHATRQAGDAVATRSFESVAVPGHARALLRQEGGGEHALGEPRGDTLLSTLDGVTVAASEDHLLTYSDTGVAPGTGEARIDELIVPRGGEFRLVLPDGTGVTLNASSRLAFPRRFAGNERRVRLEGEAFFDVTRDTARPFIVETALAEVKVLGTRFNVAAYPDNATRHVTLLEGRVETRVPGQPSIGLLPGEQAYHSGGTWEKRAVDAGQYTSWMKGKFLFKDTELEEIARQLSRWYDVDITFSDERLKAIRFTGGIVRYNPVEELIRLIEATSEARFRVEGKRLVIDRNAKPEGTKRPPGLA
jgi:ferric-dicitrate binding protein FerR (iron transport regulator)